VAHEYASHISQIERGEVSGQDALTHTSRFMTARAHVLRALRVVGMPMDEIRRAAAIVRAEFDDPFVLATRRIATDGVAVFVRLADESLVRARDHQHAIKEVLEHHLHDIDWDDTGAAIRLRLPRYPSGAEVVIDPRFGWGSPVLTANKVKVEDVVALWRTGEPISAVAEEYDLTETVVEDVLRQAASVLPRPQPDRRPRHPDRATPDMLSTSSPSSTPATLRRSATPNGSPKAAARAGPCSPRTAGSATAPTNSAP